ncbi:unknown [Prevotella sp. CAG:487]|nr:unknown [Prevotella sp. CAG:487]
MVESLACGARLAVLIQVGAQTVAVDVERELCREHVVDERSLVDVLAVAALRVAVVACAERSLHIVYRLVQCRLRAGRQFGEVIVFGRLVLVCYPTRGQFVSAAVHGMILRPVVLWLVVAVYLHVEVSGEIAVVLARVVKVETILSLAHTFRHDEHSIISAVENELAELCVRHIVEIRARQFEGEHIAYHALVGERGEQRPVVVLAHTHYLHLLLLASLLERFVQRAERVWLLFRAVERRVASVFQPHISLIVHLLVRMGYGVTVVVLSLSVVNNLHPRRDTVLTLYHLSVYVDEDNRHVGSRKPHIRIVSRLVVV